MKSLLLLVVAVALVSLAPLPSRAAEAKKDRKRSSSAHDDSLFNETRILPLKIEIPTAGLDALKRDPKEYVRATVKEGDKAFVATGVRYKGANNLSAKEGKPSFTLKFNEFLPDQSFRGQNKITLDSCPNDPSFLGELIANDLFRAAGVAAPRCNFARVELNGRDLGLYLVSEGVNRDFLGRHFDKTKGNLYEGSHRDVTSKLDKDSGDDRKDQPDLVALADVLKETDAAKRVEKLKAVLDFENFITFAALEVLVGHTGGYCLATNKYRMYHDPVSDKFFFLPHGLDAVFEQSDAPMVPSWRGAVAKAVLESESGKTQYRERMGKLLATVFKADALQRRITDIAAKIRPVVAEKDSNAGTAFDQAVTQLKERIAKRAAFLETQVAGAK